MEKKSRAREKKREVQSPKSSQNKSSKVPNQACLNPVPAFSTTQRPQNSKHSHPTDPKGRLNHYRALRPYHSISPKSLNPHIGPRTNLQQFQPFRTHNRRKSSHQPSRARRRRPRATWDSRSPTASSERDSFANCVIRTCWA